METLYDRICPVVDQKVRKVFGMRLPDLTDDLCQVLTDTRGGVIDTSIPFKQAKRQFKKEFLGRLLGAFGSVTEVSKVAGMKRESVHRLMKKLDISTDGDLRHYMKEKKVRALIGDCIDAYGTTLHPERIRDMYDSIPSLSVDVVRALPDDRKDLSEAERDWEIAYLRKALAENNGNISATARAIELRFETLHRKLKSLGLK